jgi:hypothetical protein
MVMNRAAMYVTIALGLLSGACGSSPRYIATSTPIDVLGIAELKFCIAVDPGDAQGAWTWEPGPSGCSTRSTGPTVFHAVDAAVRTESGIVKVHFVVPMMIGDPRPVELTIQDGKMQAGVSGDTVVTERRATLNVPPRNEP